MSLVTKGIFTGLTPSEKLFLMIHPHLVLTIKENASKALAEAIRRYRRDGLHNGNGDAFRHCYWSALLTRDIGEENARSFTTAHENYSTNSSAERAMDLPNNSIGIQISKLAATPQTDRVLAISCASALRAGKLMIVPPSSGNPYPY